MKLILNKKILMVTLTVLAVIDLISTYLLFNIDKIINGDLYFYGLQADIVWQTKYWINMDTGLVAVFASIILVGISLSLLYFYDLNTNKKVLTAHSSILIAVSFAAAIIIFLMIKIDSLVFTELRDYGLRYEFEWTRNYYLFSRLILSLKIVTVAATSILSGWILYTLIKPKQRMTKFSSIILLFIGSLTTLVSAMADLSVYEVDFSSGVNIGLGLILIGLITGYITPQQLIKKKIFSSQLISTYEFLDTNLKKIGIFNRIMYIPKMLTKDNDNYVLIQSNKKKDPLQEKVLNLKELLEKNQKLIAPGNELLQLFERELKKDFTEVSLSYLRKNLANLIIDKLEIATDFQMKHQENSVEVEFENSIFTYRVFERKYEEIIQAFGCPLSSAIACAIAKVTNKFTTIVNYEIDKKNHSTSVIYNLI